MADPKNETDEKRFNETLKRMLKTPPKLHSDSNVTPSNRKNVSRNLGAQKRTDKERE